MKVTAIQNYGYGRTVCKQHQAKHSIATIPALSQKPDEVSFQGNKAAKGLGLGACLGLLTVTVLSGGAATPLVLGIAAGTTGLVGGMVGNAMDEDEKKNTDQKT